MMSLILLSSCGSPSQNRIPLVDSEFDKYISKFEKIYAVNVNIGMIFKNQQNNIVGTCYYFKNKKFNYIEIDNNYWNSVEDSFREELIFHELGHCILDRGHDEELISSNSYLGKIPKSIMYPFVFGYEYERYENYYLEELNNSEIDWTLYF